MNDALAPEDAMSMTHQTPVQSKPYVPQGNPQVLGDIGNFAGGGLHGVLKGRGVEMPSWMDKPAEMLNSEGANTALSVMPGLGTIAARSDITKDILKSLLAKGMNRQQIAEHLGAGLATIDRSMANYGLGPRSKPIVRSPTPQADLQDMRSKSYGTTPSKSDWVTLPDGTMQRVVGTPQSQGVFDEPAVKDLVEYLKQYKE